MTDLKTIRGYGEEILRLRWGSWYWCISLQSLCFLTDARRHPSIEISLPIAQNTLAGATRRAAKETDGALKGRHGWPERERNA